MDVAIFLKSSPVDLNQVAGHTLCDWRAAWDWWVRAIPGTRGNSHFAIPVRLWSLLPVICVLERCGPLWRLSGPLKSSPVDLASTMIRPPGKDDHDDIWITGNSGPRVGKLLKRASDASEVSSDFERDLQKRLMDIGQVETSQAPPSPTPPATQPRKRWSNESFETPSRSPPRSSTKMRARSVSPEFEPRSEPRSRGGSGSHGEAPRRGVGGLHHGEARSREGSGSHAEAPRRGVGGSHHGEARSRGGSGGHGVEAPRRLVGGDHHGEARRSGGSGGHGVEAPRRLVGGSHHGEVRSLPPPAQRLRRQEQEPELSVRGQSARARALSAPIQPSEKFCDVCGDELLPGETRYKWYLQHYDCGLAKRASERRLDKNEDLQ